MRTARALERHLMLNKFNYRRHVILSSFTGSRKTDLIIEMIAEMVQIGLIQEDHELAMSRERPMIVVCPLISEAMDLYVTR